VQWISGLSTHPLGECLVMSQQRRIVPALRETLGLGYGVHVQQARSDRVEARR
jgi:hypothetical protein